MFVHIIEFTSSKIEELRALGDEWEAAAGADSTAVRRLMCEDRDQPGRYANVVLFDSYESAMKNSESPVTTEFSQKMAALVDGPPTFRNLDVIDESDMS
jgi:hypothetical protein